MSGPQIPGQTGGQRLLGRLVAAWTYYRRMIPFVRAVGRGAHRSVLAAGERLLAVRPGEALVIEMMAHSAGALGRVDEARQLWLRALELQPDHFGALSGLASSFVEAGDNERAYPLVRRALAAAPSPPEPVDELALRLNRWLGFVMRRPKAGERYRRQHEQRQERLARWVEWAHEYSDWCETVLDSPAETVH